MRINNSAIELAQSRAKVTEKFSEHRSLVSELLISNPRRLAAYQERKFLDLQNEITGCELELLDTDHKILEKYIDSLLGQLDYAYQQDQARQVKEAAKNEIQKKLLHNEESAQAYKTYSQAMAKLAALRVITHKNKSLPLAPLRQELAYRLKRYEELTKS